MNIKDNKNFLSVRRYKRISINDVLNTYHTLHLDSDRAKRINLALKLNEWPSDKAQAEIDQVFIVDKGHKDGKELHCVSKRGIIFILNETKYIQNQNGFITALIARPNQVKRLYRDVNLSCPKEILDICERNQEAGFNHM